MISKRRRRLLARLRQRRGREREGRVLVEGWRAVSEVRSSGAAVDFVVATEEALGSTRGGELADELALGDDAVAVVGRDAFASLTDTEAPQGIAVVVKEPAWCLAELSGGRLAVLDGLQDPGNAGTLIRTAWAFGLDGAVALDGTVDVWNPKAVRASAGAGFHLPLVRTSWEEFQEWAASGAIPLVAAGGAGRDVREVEPGDRWALAVGNEGSGVRPELRDAARDEVALPMPGGAESLNAAVAGAILLWELALGRER